MSKKRKKTKEKKASRYIPQKISREVEKRHFFECAWCGTSLTERHHIKEWHLGGEHSEDNLILLCPNCHTKTHQGVIKAKQLKERKSTHLKGDRIPGGFQTTIKEPKFKVGNNLVEDVRHIIAIGYQPILSVEDKNGYKLISACFYDENGDLMFWMSRNLFWAPSRYKITNSQDLLRIDDVESAHTILKIQKDGECLQVECENYLDHSLFRVTPNKDVIIKTRHYDCIFSNCQTKGYHIGFWIYNDRHTREGFLEHNNEKCDKKGSFLVIEPKHENENIVVDRRFVFSTVKINFFGQENVTGTGCIIYIQKSKDKIYPILIFDKDLTRNSSDFRFELVYPEKIKPQGIIVQKYKQHLIFYNNNNIKLCALNIAPALSLLSDKNGAFEAVTSLDFGLVENDEVIVLDILTMDFKYRTLRKNGPNCSEFELTEDLSQHMVGSPVFSYKRCSKSNLTYLENLKLIGIYQGDSKVISAASLSEF